MIASKSFSNNAKSTLDKNLYLIFSLKNNEVVAKAIADPIQMVCRTKFLSMSTKSARAENPKNMNEHDSPQIVIKYTEV